MLREIFKLFHHRNLNSIQPPSTREGDRLLYCFGFNEIAESVKTTGYIDKRLANRFSFLHNIENFCFNTPFLVVAIPKAISVENAKKRPTLESLAKNNDNNNKNINKKQLHRYSVTDASGLH